MSPFRNWLRKKLKYFKCSNKIHLWKSLENQKHIIKFSKRNKIPFFFKNNYQKCTKYKADGIFIDSANKNNIKPILLKKTFKIIGSAHNQSEYNKKLQQNCEILMFSPLFYNEKYSKNKILSEINLKKILMFFWILE